MSTTQNIFVPLSNGLSYRKVLSNNSFNRICIAYPVCPDVGGVDHVVTEDFTFTESGILWTRPFHSIATILRIGSAKTVAYQK